LKRYSILNNLDKCYFCGRPRECIHEVFYGTANRKISIQNGFCVGLCNYHHDTGGNNCVHENIEMDQELKRLYQTEYEKTHTRASFISLIGKNYLDKDYIEY
jgi:hypothetical protein